MNDEWTVTGELSDEAIAALAELLSALVENNPP